MARYVEIYELVDPRDNSVRYVGKANNARARLKSHIRDSRHRNTPVYAWIRKLISLGLVPIVRVVETCEATVWQERERAVIEARRSTNPRLLNLADGGDEPFCPTAVRASNGARNAKARDRRLWNAKREMGLLLQKGFVSESTKQKMRGRPDVFGQFAVYL